MCFLMCKRKKYTEEINFSQVKVKVMCQGSSVSVMVNLCSLMKEKKHLRKEFWSSFIFKSKLVLFETLYSLVRNI